MNKIQMMRQEGHYAVRQLDLSLTVHHVIEPGKRTTHIPPIPVAEMARKTHIEHQQGEII